MTEANLEGFVGRGNSRNEPTVFLFGCPNDGCLATTRESSAMTAHLRTCAHKDASIADTDLDAASDADSTGVRSKPFQCPKCQRGFTTKEGVKNHRRK